jgi:transcriptional regulator with XRE-family HTH domain
MMTMARRQTTVSEQLREAIRQEERSRYRISLETGIAQGQLSRFMQGKCGLSLRSIDLLCECLGLGLTALKRKGR